MSGVSSMEPKKYPQKPIFRFLPERATKRPTKIYAIIIKIICINKVSQLTANVEYLLNVSQVYKTNTVDARLALLQICHYVIY